MLLTNDGTSMDILDSVSLNNSDNSIITVGIADGDGQPLLTSDVTQGKIKLAYDKPTSTAETLTNWLGFEIEEYTVVMLKQ